VAKWLPGSRDDIAELLNCVDVYVLGSLREGISNTILEAMACGLPVIASATGGNPELVEAGVTGALVKSGDTDELTSAIINYARDAAMRATQGAAARARVLERFSLRRMIEDYRCLYREVLANKGATN